jgi:hypothetical protein
MFCCSNNYFNNDIGNINLNGSNKASDSSDPFTIIHINRTKELKPYIHHTNGPLPSIIAYEWLVHDISSASANDIIRCLRNLNIPEKDEEKQPLLDKLEEYKKDLMSMTGKGGRSQSREVLQAIEQTLEKIAEPAKDVNIKIIKQENKSQSECNLETLPKYILPEIAGFLHNRDFCSLRLTNKKINTSLFNELKARTLIGDAENVLTLNDFQFCLTKVNNFYPEKSRAKPLTVLANRIRNLSEATPEALEAFNNLFDAINALPDSLRETVFNEMVPSMEILPVDVFEETSLRLIDAIKVLPDSDRVVFSNAMIRIWRQYGTDLGGLKIIKHLIDTTNTLSEPNRVKLFNGIIKNGGLLNQQQMRPEIFHSFIDAAKTLSELNRVMFLKPLIYNIRPLDKVNFDRIMDAAKTLSEPNRAAVFTEMVHWWNYAIFKDLIIDASETLSGPNRETIFNEMIGSADAQKNGNYRLPLSFREAVSEQINAARKNMC